MPVAPRGRRERTTMEGESQGSGVDQHMKDTILAMRLPILIIHICAGVVGVLSGAAAMSFRKGSRPHRVGGNLFFVAMLVMGSSAAYLGNVVGGLFACYLVATAWLTQAARRGNEYFRLGCVSVCLGARSCPRDPWRKTSNWNSCATTWSSCWNDLFRWFRGAACCRGRPSHARARRRLW